MQTCFHKYQRLDYRCKNVDHLYYMVFVNTGVTLSTYMEMKENESCILG